MPSFRPATAALSVACCAAALIGCGGSAGGDDAATRPVSDAPADADRELIEEYIALLNEGDVDAAMHLRCREGRIEADEAELFGEQVERLVDEAGPITVEAVAEVPRSGFRPVGRGQDVRELQVLLSGSRTVADEPVVVILLDQGGEPRLCGYSSARAAAFHGPERPEPSDLGQAQGPVEFLVPVLGGDEFTLTEDQPLPLDDARGATGGWTRAWQRPSYGGARVTAVRFSSDLAAQRYAEARIRDSLTNTVDTFEVPGTEGAVGLRLFGYAWLWSQPATEGRFMDRVVLLMSGDVVIIDVTGLPAGSGHQVVEDIANWVLALAGIHSSPSGTSPVIGSRPDRTERAPADRPPDATQERRRPRPPRTRS